jgi:hypothetical protein
LLDPFKNKDSSIGDFNKNPNKPRYNKGRIQFVEKSSGEVKIKGDEFFYKIQKTVGRSEIIQKELAKSGNSKTGDITGMHSLANPNYVEIDSSESGSDMEIAEIREKEVQKSVIISERPEEKVFKNIFNSSDED